MEPLRRLCGTAAALMIDNIDTDQIVPGKTLLRIDKTGYEKALFSNWRFLSDGREDPAFVLNRAPFRSAMVLVTGQNFGCGSSRAGALLPIRLADDAVKEIAAEIEASHHGITVDLEVCAVVTALGRRFTFTVPRLEREALLAGQDRIAVTLARNAIIEAFQDRDRLKRPWIYQTNQHEGRDS